MMKIQLNVQALLLLATMLAALFGFAGTASANGKPVRLALDYVEGVSNWGPREAHGVAVVAVSEGEVTVDVDGLPALTEDTYQVWLVESEGGRYIPVGTLNVGSGGHASLNEVIEDLPSGPYSLLVLTVEPRTGVDQVPDSRRSLVGYFPRGKPAPLPTPIPTPTPDISTPEASPTETEGAMVQTPGEQVEETTIAYLPATGTGGGPLDGLAWAVLAGSIGLWMVGCGIHARKHNHETKEGS